MSRTIIKLLGTVAPALLLCACINNDIPYPHIQANIVSIVAENEMRPATIDSTNRTVTFYLPEEVDIYNVNIESYTLSPDAVVVGDSLSKPLDLSEEVTVTLHHWYDYQWTLSAQQTIERYFEVDGQIGSSVIDIPARRVVATVTEAVDMGNLLVKRIKLGPEGCTMSPDLENRTVDFTHPVEVIITDHGRRQIWTIYIEQTESTITTSRVDAWSNVAWVYGEGQADNKNTVQYRIKGDSEWITVPDSWLVADGGSFYARLIHLSPQTTYEARAINETEQGVVLTFTTGTTPQCPNSNFDSWWLDGKIWCPWAEGGTPYWGTGNKGATTLGPSNTVPTEDTPSGTGFAAMLETKFVGIGMIGKLAAGNIFVGSYVATDGTNGILSFGREFTQRPTKLRGYLKYKTAPISSVSEGFESLKGRPDTCIVWCSLIDQDTPFEIRTKPSNRQLFDQNGSYVVAYGSTQYGENIDNYIPFEIELEYKSTQRVPKYILITASASKYGDYFVGGNGAVLWLDDLELVYDY